MCILYMLENNLLKTKAFQHGDNRSFSSRKGAKRGLSAWRCLFRPHARQPTANARNARLLLDRRPCSTYWQPVGRAEGTMCKMSSHTMGTRPFMTLQLGQTWKVHSQDALSSCPPSDTVGEAALSWDLSLESGMPTKRSPQSPTKLSHFRWFKWCVITFFSHCLLVEQCF